jgi:hypothetical protein
MISNSLPDIITKSINDGIIAMQNVVDNNSYCYNKFDLDCSALPEPVWRKGEDIPKSISHFFTQLPDKKKPCLYYYEILNLSTEEILEAYRNYRINPS